MNVGSVSRFVLSAMFVSLGCSGNGFGLDGIVQFVDHDIDIGRTQSGAIQIVNMSKSPVSDVTFEVQETFDVKKVDVGGAVMQIIPGVGKPLAHDRKLDLGFTIQAPRLPPGRYELLLGVFANGELSDRTLIRWGKSQGSNTLVDRMKIVLPDISQVAVGDTLDFDLDAFASNGQSVHTIEARWFVLPTNAGIINGRGTFVPTLPGPVRIVAAIGNVTDDVEFTVALSQ